MLPQASNPINATAQVKHSCTGLVSKYEPATRDHGAKDTLLPGPQPLWQVLLLTSLGHTCVIQVELSQLRQARKHWQACVCHTTVAAYTEACQAVLQPQRNVYV
jgi:hypothetical protein